MVWLTTSSIVVRSVVVSIVYNIAVISITVIASVNTQEVTISVIRDDFTFSNSSRYELDRTCQYQGSQQLDHLEWLLNGVVFKNGTSGAISSVLSVHPVTLSHAGRWECRAVFSDGTISSPVNAGTLTVYDPNDVIAPPHQYALISQSYTLNCSLLIANPFISWLHNGSDVPPTIPSVQLSDEGMYVCRASVNGASVDKPVQFNVIVPPQILFFPQFGNRSFSNEQVTLTVTFQSHQEATTIVRWFKNNIPISSTNINTRYGPAPNATTELRFVQITREDRGSYRVEIENTAEVIPAAMRRDASTFDLNIQVPPSRPAGVTVSRINDTHVNIHWTLTNQTADAGAEVLTLHLQDHPNSPFRLEPNQEEWILYSEPGMMYNLTLKAMNPDGVVTTDPMVVNFPATAPAIKGFSALRVNNTAFNFTLEVFYTGGGDIKLFSIENGSSSFILLTSVTPVLSQTSPRQWYAVITDSMFDGLEDPRFNINVTNAMEQSVIQQVQGEIVLPGCPSILSISTSSNSITVRIQLSDIGTDPTLTVELNVTLGSHLIDTIKWSGNFIRGKLLDPVIVSSLQPNTNYTFKTVAVNQQGPGASSIEFIFTEGAQSHAQQRQIPIVLIAIPVAGGLIILIGIAIILILCCCCKVKRNKPVRISTHSSIILDDSQCVFALYSEVKDIKQKHKAEESDASEPKIPQKQLTEDFNEKTPTVLQQNLTTEDIQQMGVSTKASEAASIEEHLYAVLEHNLDGKENVTRSHHMTAGDTVQYSEIK